MSQKCLVILGMHRSGTSALAGVLDCLGVPMGKELIQAERDNPKGFFENKVLKNFNERVLKQNDSAWNDPRPLRLDYSELLADPELSIRAKQIISDDYSDLSVFGIKDPRMCLMLPFWLEIFAQMDVEPLFILPYRSPMDVVGSLHNRSGYPHNHGLLLWTKYVLAAELYSRGQKRVFVSYSGLMSSPAEFIQYIENSLSIDMPVPYSDAEAKVQEFLEKGLRHHNSTLDDLPENAPLFIRSAAENYISMVNDECCEADLLASFDMVQNEYRRFASFFYDDLFWKDAGELARYRKKFSKKRYKFLLKLLSCI